jgi:hypothetical protein
MRSVFVHLWDTDERRVSAALDRLYPIEGPYWLLRVAGDPCLYIHFCRDGPRESEDWAAEFTSRGSPPAVTVVADVSGRHEGTPEARDFVLRMLAEFDGVATDDGWEHLWTRAEVEADRPMDGRRFGYWRDEGCP